MNLARQFISDIAEHISIPEIYLDIRELIRQPDAEIQDYVALVEKDSMLSVRVIRMANSEFFGFARKAQNLQQAINLIGVIQLQDLILSSICMRTFTSIPNQILNLREFWSYSTKCGIAARVIAQHSYAPILNHFFTLGLLHEIGHAAMYTSFPDQCLSALEDSQSQHSSLQLLEREYLGFDYCEAGSMLMELWRLPDVYQQVAKHHLDPGNAENNFKYETQVIHLAHTICQNPEINQHQEIISSSRESFQQLQRLPSNIDKIIIDEIEQHTDDVLTMLWPISASGPLFEDEIPVDE